MEILILALVLIFILFVWGLPLLRFLLIRLSFAIELLFRSGFGKDFDFCFKSFVSLFKNTRGKKSDLLIFYCGTIYMIKLCGFLRRRSDIAAVRSDCWQVTAWCAFYSNTAYKSIRFDLRMEKSRLESNIWNLPKINTVETMILLLPKPRSFGVRADTDVEFLGSGNRWMGHTVGTVRYLREALRELREERGDTVSIDDDQWKAIKKEYRKV